MAPTVRILVVEDNPHVARLIRDGLTGYHQRTGDHTTFTTEHASNGKEALNCLMNESFDLLIVDIYLPVMDGASLIRAARKEERWQDLPIIAVSAGADEAKQMALEAGADFFLDKPFRLSDVLQTMRKLLATSKKKKTKPE
jgi:CheY-like chemotaxis protein